MKPTKLAALGAMLMVGVGAAMVAFAQEKQAGAIKEAAGGEMGEIRLRTMAPITYVYVEMETTFDKLGEGFQEAMPKMIKAAADGKFKLNSPVVLAYPGGNAHVQPDKPFKVHIGVKAEGEAAASGDVKVRTTEEFRAATVIYTGPPSEMGACYLKLIPAIHQMGLETSGEEREFTLYWEGFDSPNNIILVQIGVKEKK